MRDILPPANEAASTGTVSSEPNPPKGWPGVYVPNFSEWQRGDIVLVRSDRTATGRFIEAGQVLSTSAAMRAGREWTHAAIYVGDGMVIDATPRQPIMRRSVWAYCQDRPIAVRRLRAGPQVTGAQVQSIATAAEGFLQLPYSMWRVVIDKLKPRWFSSQTQRGSGQRLYCSTLVARAVVEATEIDLASEAAHRPLYPAVLWSHPLLDPVHVEWRHL